MRVASASAAAASAACRALMATTSARAARPRATAWILTTRAWSSGLILSKPANSCSCRAAAKARLGEGFRASKVVGFCRIEAKAGLGEGHLFYPRGTTTAQCGIRA